MIASILVPELFCQVECLGRPSLAGRPLVVGGHPDHHGRVVAASRAARARGVAPGQPLAMARARCDTAVFVPGHLGRAIDLVSAIQTALEERLPGLAWATPVHALLVNHQAANAELHAGLDRSRAELALDLGVTVSCGIGTSRVVADVAARLVQPRGLLHVLPGYESTVLSPVSVRWLDGVDAALLDRLGSSGVQTFGDLARLSSSDALALAGGAGLVLRGLAQGHDPRSLPEATPLPRLTALVRPEGSPGRDGDTAPTGPFREGTDLPRALQAAMARLQNQADRRRRRPNGGRIRLWTDSCEADDRIIAIPAGATPDRLDDLLASVSDRSSSGRCRWSRAFVTLFVEPLQAVETARTPVVRSSPAVALRSA